MATRIDFICLMSQACACTCFEQALTETRAPHDSCREGTYHRPVVASIPGTPRRHAQVKPTKEFLDGGTAVSRNSRTPRKKLPSFCICLRRRALKLAPRSRLLSLPCQGGANTRYGGRMCEIRTRNAIWCVSPRVMVATGFPLLLSSSPVSACGYFCLLGVGRRYVAKPKLMFRLTSLLEFFNEGKIGFSFDILSQEISHLFVFPCFHVECMSFEA